MFDLSAARRSGSHPAGSRSASRSKGLALIALALAVALALALTGCGGAETPADTTGGDTEVSSQTTYPYTMTDDAGREVTIDAEPQVIVSLAPANTEILFAIGAGDRVQGVTSYDDYPAEVVDIAKVGDFAGPNLEAVAALNPDLVLLTSGVQGEMIQQLEDLGATAVVIDPTTVQAVMENIVKVGAAVNENEGAAEVVADMQDRLDAVKVAVSAELAEPVTAFIEIGQNPLFSAGPDTLLGEAISIAGGENVVTESGYVSYSAEQVIAANPQVYLFTSMSGASADDIAGRPGHAGLTATSNGDVVEIEDNLISRPGPRIIEGIEQLLEAFRAAAAR